MKKKIIGFISLILSTLILFSMSACGNKRANPGDGKLRVLCSVFPIYDWTLNITAGCENAPEVSLLIENGTDMHSFNPSVIDVAKILEADIFIYVGGESDSWVEELLASADSEKLPKVISLTELLGENILSEEIKEGMQAEEEDCEDEPEIDEHVWLSVRNAEFFVSELCTVLSGLCPEEAASFVENADSYIRNKLIPLEDKFASLGAIAGSRALIVADRFPFSYLFKDCGIDYYAAFPGCSTEQNADFETIIFLSEKLKESGRSCVLITESSSGDIARAVLSASGEDAGEILSLDSMQSINKRAVSSGSSYVSIMESNYDILYKALSQ